MDEKEIAELIRFHQAGLDQYRSFMSPSVQYLEERTIEALRKLLWVLRDTAKMKVDKS